ncbi:Pkinase-domain-containing protein [Cryphonectria parasitica EP155]|uniref:non-specific serine/threonine protein kinase n=1 Tax=Cryphonectria parasitica (strain ATCC 38755 / EP155) TaxID=660469 RepID=A0A9P5CST9_CRYP1|nr:Pkinase-domain-containing protein [Cryphonectria parasitica EP155]KAF3768470.1 Pkinase-domain-containing protein [Cryphonectria parasitica EP155]
MHQVIVVCTLNRLHMGVHLLRRNSININISSMLYSKIKIKTHFEQFYSRLGRAPPSLGHLDLASIPPSSTLATAARGARQPYVPQAKIGNGAYGTVYRAVHSYTGAYVAVKEIHKLNERSLQEPAILQSLSHRNIVKFIEFISMGHDNTMIVMELVHGPNLEISHQQSPFTLDDT